MASRSDKELQRYFDGELSPRAARRMRERLEGSDEDRQRVHALDAIRSSLREATDAAADEADFGGLWSRVQAGIAREKPLSLGERAGFWLRRYGLVTAAAAAAIVVAVILLRPVEPPPPRNDAVIEKLDVGPEAVGTIFTIADPAGKGQTTVIWVTETSSEGDE